MRQLAIWLLAAACATAGTIQGVVIEHASGRPLARTVVRLEPVPKSGGEPLSTRAGTSGQFVFASVPTGTYFLKAVRSGYFPAAHGQRLPAGSGKPISITADSTLFAELRMRHQGALTGRALDENGVGAQGVSVLAYHSRLPLRSVGEDTTDDRGVFRIAGLEPGKYWVRSGGHRLEDGGGWLPTFSPQGREVRSARVYQVAVDADTAYADVSPEPGPLFSAGGFITCEKPGMVFVTLSSGTGQRSSQSYCGPGPAGYQFQGLPAGLYELFVAQQDNIASGFEEFTLGSNTQVNVSLSSPPDIDIEIRETGSDSIADIPVTLTGRRQNLSNTGNTVEIRGARATLAPGYWELRAKVPAGHYVDSIVNVRTTRGRRWNAVSAPEWYEVFLEQHRRARIRITVSKQAGQVAGRVMAESRPVPGAPVFLWPVAESARRSLGGSLQLVSDTEGNFQFDSLPPGDYRVLASFDISELDEDLIQLSSAPVFHVEPSKTSTADLPLWVAQY